GTIAGGKREFERPPERVQNHVENKVFPGQSSVQGDAVRPGIPIRLSELYAVPAFSGAGGELRQAQATLFRVRVAQQSPLDEEPCEALNAGISLQLRPIEPARFVVPAIGVVVSGLRAARLVSHADHGYADRKQSDCQEILNLTGS